VLQFVLSIFLLFGTQQDQVEINAAGPQEWNENIYHAKDNVVVIYRDVRIEADEVTFDRNTNVVNADNHIKLKKENENVEADHVVFNVDTKVGDFTNIHGEVGPGIFIKAEEAHRTAEGV